MADPHSTLARQNRSCRNAGPCGPRTRLRRRCGPVSDLGSDCVAKLDLDRPLNLLSNSVSAIKPISEPFVFTGNTVVSEVFTSVSAGWLHHSALWLWPPNVIRAMTNGCSFRNKKDGFASAIVPVGTSSSAFEELCGLFVMPTPWRPPSSQASGTPRR